MIVKKIALVNFRNYHNQVFEFHSHINLIIGENAQGKTNLIEAIYLLSLAKSFRTRFNKEMIYFDETFARIVGLIESNQRNKELQLILSDVGKRAKIDNKEIRKTSDFVGQLNVVVFTPDDLTLVKGSPSIRRRFIDIELSKINKKYLYDYNQYLQLLKERNLFLKDLNYKNKQSDVYLDVLSEQMAKIQVNIINQRKHFIHQLNEYAKGIYADISNNSEILDLSYKCYYDLNQEDLYQHILDKYQKNIHRDIRYMKTNDGIHKDDVYMVLNDRDAQIYASQGQQRSIVLAMKIGLLSLIKDEINEYPILLLDDVLSELDKQRKVQLLDLIDENIQTFITSTSIESIMNHEIFMNAKKFEIKEGNLKGGHIDG